MTTLRDHLAEYLRMRRELGYRLEKLELLAGQFCDWLDRRRQDDLHHHRRGAAGRDYLAKPTLSGGRYVWARCEPSPPTCTRSGWTCRSHPAGSSPRGQADP